MNYQRISRLKDMVGIGVDVMSKAADAANDSSFLRLENLDTDLPPPSIALEITRQIIDRDDSNSYLPFFGLDSLRKAATAHVSKMSGLNYDWNTQCLISAGGLSGILNCLLTLIESGDEVIVTDPIYVGLINRIHIAGGIPKFVKLIPSSDGWRLDLSSLKQAVSERTKAILIMSPSMPTGHVLNVNEWEAVAEACNKSDAWLLYNAAMERILFDGLAPFHPASLPGMQERTITIGSASKELRMIGWRVGWIVGPHLAINDIALVSLSNVVCQVGISMPGVAAALNADNAGIKEAVKIWEKRRNCMLNELDGLPVIPPQGGWSMLIDTMQIGLSSVDASQRLFSQAKIAATPMKGWGESGSRYLRLVFSNEPENRLAGMRAKIRKAWGLSS